MTIKPNTVITLVVIIVGIFSLSINSSRAADTFSDQQAENTFNQQDNTDSKSKAEIATESFEESDAKPTGSWASGCSPESASEASASLNEEDCLPENTQEKQ